MSESDDTDTGRLDQVKSKKVYNIVDVFYVSFIIGLFTGTLPLYSSSWWWPLALLTVAEVYLLHQFTDKIEYKNLTKDNTTKVKLFGYSLYLMNVISYAVGRNVGHYGIIMILRYMASIIKNLWLEA